MCVRACVCGLSVTGTTPRGQTFLLLLFFFLFFSPSILSSVFRTHTHTHTGFFFHSRCVQVLPKSPSFPWLWSKKKNPLSFWTWERQLELWGMSDDLMCLITRPSMSFGCFRVPVKVLIDEWITGNWSGSWSDFTNKSCHASRTYVIMRCLLAAGY